MIEEIGKLSSELEADPFRDARILEDREINIIGWLYAKERETERERTDVVCKLERAVSIEASRIGQRGARTGRGIVGVLARVIKINPHCLPVVGDYSAGGGA